MYSGCTLKLAKLRVFKGFLYLGLPGSLRNSTLGDFGFGAVGLRLVHWGPLGAWWHRRATPRLGRASPGRAPPSRDATERSLAPGDGLSAYNFPVVDV